ncbi:MAG: amidohydrolase [bacterium]|nr:amidohydrolase [bacterium]
MTNNILIKNAKAIVTCDNEDSVFYNHDLLISGNKITQIAKNINTSNADIIDAKDMFVYPGLINTHHHFFQSFVRNNPGLDFTKMDVIEWLHIIYQLFTLIDSDSIYYSSLVSMADLIKHGCTTVFDHQYCFNKHAGNDLIDRQFDAADKLGIRFHAGRGTNTMPMSEGSVIPDELCESTDNFLNDCNRIIEKYHDVSEFSMKKIVVAPCNVSQSYKETFIEAVKLARFKNVFMHTHLGEGENRLMLDRYGKRSLNWCEDIGFIGKDVWFAHGWEFTDREIDTLVKTGTGVSHCPAPVALGHFNIIDIPQMIAKGLRLGLGVDGSASNDNSNMLELPRMTYQLQNLVSDKRNHPLPDAYDYLKLATNGGAALLGRNDIGSLEVNKAADLFMINMNRLEYVGTHHSPKSFLSRVGHFAYVDKTIINGKIVFDSGKLIGCNELEETEKASKTLEKIIYNAPAYKSRKSQIM